MTALKNNVSVESESFSGFTYPELLDVFTERRSSTTPTPWSTRRHRTPGRFIRCSRRCKRRESHCAYFSIPRLTARLT